MYGFVSTSQNSSIDYFLKFVSGFFLMFLFLLLSGNRVQAQKPNGSVMQNGAQLMRTQKAGFIENKGQIVDQDGKPNADVKFLFRGRGMNVQLRAHGFSYDLFRFEKVRT